MHSPEQSYSKTSSNPQTPKKSVDYGSVANRVKDIQLQENEDITNQSLEDLDTLGLTVDDLSESQAKATKTEKEKVQDHTQKLTLESRLTALQKTDQPLSAVLQTLKLEFGETMDEETQAVLDNFSSLVSPEVITDPQEREAVEVLFATQSITTFDQKSFSGFVETIFQEETISEETKQRIEKKFGIPRSPIKSGKELAQWTQIKDEDGNFLHNSPETALEFRKGVKTHVDKQGNTLLTISSDARTSPLNISAERLRNGESLASLANYSLIRNVVYQEFDGMTNLFGGGDEDDLGNPSESSIKDANNFARLLIGKRSPNSILSKEDLSTLKQALTALHNPSVTGENAVEGQLHELGVLSKGDIQWLKLEEIGSILRNNQNFKTFEHAHVGGAHHLLKQALKPQSDHETQPTNIITESMHALESSVQVFLGWIKSGFKCLFNQYLLQKNGITIFCDYRAPLRTSCDHSIFPNRIKRVRITA